MYKKPLTVITGKIVPMNFPCIAYHIGFAIQPLQGHLSVFDKIILTWKSCKSCIV